MRKMSEIILEMIDPYYNDLSEVEALVKQAAIGWNAAIMEQTGHTDSFNKVLEDLELEEGNDDKEELTYLINKFRDMKLMYHKNDNRMIMDTIVKGAVDGGLHLDVVGSEVELPKEVKVGRNDPCLCGSGKKYKKCCLNL
ncbi:YecA family protein [Acidaminobacter sp. JC074]|uniref:YecA family protein n=1 Tax=Acidaminobacter sp. JC074 TaxID=2530199 RepID=UPI001F11705D|nr:SEC-C metal-binding domain-containing protein [Acidaminobacter sp. JC074]